MSSLIIIINQNSQSSLLSSSSSSSSSVGCISQQSHFPIHWYGFMSQFHTAILMSHKIISQLEVTITNKQTDIQYVNNVEK